MIKSILKLFGKGQAKKRDNDALPVLDPRVRPLTPTPSNKEKFRHSAIQATAQSPFFQKLPPEIRTKILTMAFGGRTVHMDLWQDKPDVEIPKSDNIKVGALVHGRKRVYTTGHPGYKYLMRSLKEPEQWIWQGSVCHRNLPDDEPGKRFWEELEPSEDFCRYGGLGITDVGDICKMWHEKDGEASCNIGAIGWLLSCRQAYKEGIEVLYATNTIHSASKLMLLNLDKLLPPQRLSSIKSLELIWTFDPYLCNSLPIEEPCRDLESFQRFLEALPVFFPRVQRLHVAIQGQVFPVELKSRSWEFMEDTSKVIEIIEKNMLTPFDEMVHRLGPGAREVTLACSSYLYARLRGVALENNAAVVQQVHLGAEKERHWRALPSGKGRNNHLGGYWVQLGQRDLDDVYAHLSSSFDWDNPIFPEEYNVFDIPSSLPFVTLDR
ncbi:unnamed protein product [Clonostachys byssicola]|uniref:DUF7730 domain-containing protein n=1 Tax=Clonostachys byssicola TaxID=160290 RepID=A0A9N9UGH2_9HYPO|nr:unnamed protein product [Clonostachys byssicola]